MRTPDELDRRPRDPNDRWSYADAATKEELVVLRLSRTDADAESNPLYAEGPFTCDACIQAPRCALVFDAYNTDGDCLYEK